MALPTPADLLNMEYAFQAQPFLNQPAKSTIELLNMEYAFQAQPFVGNEGGAAPPALNPKGGSMAAKLVAAGVL